MCIEHCKALAWGLKQIQTFSMHLHEQREWICHQQQEQCSSVLKEGKHKNYDAQSFHAPPQLIKFTLETKALPWK